MPKYPTPEQIQELLSGPADTPVVMLNLLRFNAEADEPCRGQSGREAYGSYGVRMRKIVESYGGRFIWAGSADSLVIGDTDERFDAVALVEYPSRKAFVEIATSDHVARIGEDRKMGLEGQWLIASTETSEL